MRNTNRKSKQDYKIQNLNKKQRFKPTLHGNISNTNRRVIPTRM